MPLKKEALARLAKPAADQEEAAARANKSTPEPVEDKPVETGQPYQDFVENRLRQYLRDNNVCSLVKPTKEKIRAAAMPVLCRAMRKRPGRKRKPYLPTSTVYSAN